MSIKGNNEPSQRMPETSKRMSVDASGMFLHDKRLVNINGGLKLKQIVEAMYPFPQQPVTYETVSPQTAAITELSPADVALSAALDELEYLQRQAGSQELQDA